MGSYNYVYVGCFIEITSKETYDEVSYSVKPNGKRAKGKFNPETGDKYEVKVEMVKKYHNVNLYKMLSLLGLSEDTFTSPEYSGGGEFVDTWVYSGEKYQIKTYSDVFNLDMKSLDITKYLIDFNEEFKPLIDEIKKTNVVNVKFGICSYSN